MAVNRDRALDRNRAPFALERHAANEPPPEAANDARLAGPPPARAGTVAVLLIADIARAHRLWGWSRFVLRRWPLAQARADGLRFSKILGSGHDGGFGLRPSASCQGLFCGFDDGAAAQRFLASPLADAYREHAREWLCVTLRAFSSRGSWDRHALDVTAAPPARGPVAALTRASIRAGAAWPFWRHAPASKQALGGVPGCWLAVGLGEAPLLRQATFSLWDSIESMDGFARAGAHADAIRASRAGAFFSESMFVRFVPSALCGTWKGRTYG